MRTRAVLFLLCAAMLMLVIGCGSSSTTMNSTQPTTSSGQPPSGGSNPSATPQYVAETNDNSSGGVSGQISIDTTGAGAVAIKTKVPNASIVIKFCNFPGDTGCINIGTFNGDSSGNVNGTFTFPAKGGFVGTFSLTTGGTDVFSGGFNIPNGSIAFLATMVPAGSIGAGFGFLGGPGAIGTDAISSGFVSIAAGSSTAHIELHGVVPSQPYNAAFCLNPAGSACFHIADFNSDASGNASTDVDMSKNGVGNGAGIPGVFLVGRQIDAQHSPYEYVGGFKVP